MAVRDREAPSPDLAADVASWEASQLGSLHFDPARVPQLDVSPVVGPLHGRAAVSPDCSYRLVRDAIDGATKTIDLYIYNVSAEHMVALLRAAIARNVALRIMYDTHDTRGDEAAKLNALAGAEIKVAPSSKPRDVFTVCHQKFAVIDGGSVLLGSANWATTSIPKVTQKGVFRKGNREWLVHLRGESIAARFAALFQADWDIPAMPVPDAIGLGTRTPSDILVPAAAVTPPAEVLDIEAFDDAGAVSVTPLLSPQNYRATIVDLIARARTSIEIEQQYILQGGPATTEILTALRDRDPGVALRIIVSPAFRKVGAKDSWELTVDTLRAFGLEGTLRALNLETFTHCHNKGVIVDSRWTVVSSTNWSENSIERARETGVLIDHEALAKYFRRAFDVDWTTAWPATDVKQNLARVAIDSFLVPDAMTEIHSADLA